VSVATLNPRSGRRTDTPLNLASLYDEHYRTLVRLAAIYVDERETAEEVVQDAFVKLMTGRYDVAPEKAGAYLRSAVLNGARSELRKRRVRRAKKPDPPGLVAAAEVGGVALAERQRILDAIRRLPKKQAGVIVLRYYLDLSEAEIADTLGIARGSVKSHAHRATAKLKELLENER
jgi:RNA polymerase sigma-70 factor (sigma-E family)